MSFVARLSMFFQITKLNTEIISYCYGDWLNDTSTLIPLTVDVIKITLKSLQQRNLALWESHQSAALIGKFES
jgi:hypothetical protein